MVLGTMASSSGGPSLGQKSNYIPLAFSYAGREACSDTRLEVMTPTTVVPRRWTMAAAHTLEERHKAIAALKNFIVKKRTEARPARLEG